jgi:isoquinoline 1-oxidoreductase beta subunit
MTIHIDRVSDSFPVPAPSRRDFMVGAAGLSFAFAFGPGDDAAAAVIGPDGSGKAMSPWVAISTDGTVSIMSPAAEMGQGSLTSLPLILAEELDADWAKVRVVVAPPNDELYKNPGFGYMYTAGSNAVTSYFKELRLFGAQVRKVLLANAARHWNVPVAELTTGPNVVIHEKTGRRLSYGEIAAFAEVPEKAPDVAESELKKPEQFRLISRSTASTSRSRACSTARSCARRSRARRPTRSTTPRRGRSRACSRSCGCPMASA